MAAWRWLGPGLAKERSMSMLGARHKHALHMRSGVDSVHVIRTHVVNTHSSSSSSEPTHHTTITISDSVENPALNLSDNGWWEFVLMLSSPVRYILLSTELVGLLHRWISHCVELVLSNILLSTTDFDYFYQNLTLGNALISVAFREYIEMHHSILSKSTGYI